MEAALKKQLLNHAMYLPFIYGGRGRREQIIVLGKSIKSALIADFMWLLLTRCQHPGEPGHSEKHFYRAVSALELS